MGDVPESSTPSPASATMMTPRSVPVREDCWSEDATFTLIEAWGKRYVELNRGNLRQKQWLEVADAVNGRHGHVKKARRTDIQCKNRIDTLKKKYKVEKARVLDSNGSYTSPWPFFDPLDVLLSSTLPLKKLPPSPPPRSLPPMAVPLLRHRAEDATAAANVVVPQKRPAPAPSALMTPFRADELCFRRNYSAMAAAAAAATAVESDDDDDDDDDEEEESGGGGGGGGGGGDEVENCGGSDADGIRKLAKVIEKFGEVYARVEAEKQRQMIELEKQRMQFAKELECQRMQMLVEMQVQLEKIKRAKRSDSNDDMYS